jgi:hypothetical protein
VAQKFAPLRLPSTAFVTSSCPRTAALLLLLLLQARRAEEAKQAAEEKKKRDRENATKRVAGAIGLLAGWLAWSLFEQAVIAGCVCAHAH